MMIMRPQICGRGFFSGSAKKIGGHGKNRARWLTCVFVVYLIGIPGEYGNEPEPVPKPSQASLYHLMTARPWVMMMIQWRHWLHVWHHHRVYTKRDFGIDWLIETIALPWTNHFHWFVTMWNMDLFLLFFWGRKSWSIHHSASLTNHR